MAVNLIKNFNFRVEVDGLGVLEFQQVVTPSVEWAEHKNGSPGYGPDEKTPGKKKVGDMTVEAVVPVDGNDSAVWAWFLQAATGLKAAYARPMTFRQLDNEDSVVATYFADSVWVKKIDGQTHDTREDNSADIMRMVTLSVKDWLRLP